MTGREKVLLVMILIILIVTVILGMQYRDLETQLKVAEDELIERHQSQIESYDDEIDRLNDKNTTLQTEYDALQLEKAKIHIVTVHEIDSIRALPFEQQSVFFSAEITRLDSIRDGYLSWNN